MSKVQKVPERRFVEYGGFQPLELNPGREYFHQYEKCLSRFNSVKAALVYLLSRLHPKHIWLPYYYCPSTIEAIRKTGIDILFYHIDTKMLPVDLPDNIDTAVLLVNYFGVMDEQIEKLSGQYKKAEVIVDQAHAFFAKPIIQSHIYNVYSARKFFGVPDGAYLVSLDIQQVKKDFSISNSYAQYLLSAFEQGTNTAYHMKKDADLIISRHYNSMSLLAQGLLKNTNYNRVKKIRKKNYSLLYNMLKENNELKISSDMAAYLFPFLPREGGEIIKNKMVDQRIYVPTLWNGNDLREAGNQFEKNMAENAVFLPIDQRYNSVDMNYIGNMIFRVLDNLNAIL